MAGGPSRHRRHRSTGTLTTGVVQVGVYPGRVHPGTVPRITYSVLVEAEPRRVPRSEDSCPRTEVRGPRTLSSDTVSQGPEFQITSK